MSSQSNKVPDAMPPSPRPPPAGFVEVANDPIPWKPGTVGDRLSGRFAGFGELQGRDGAHRTACAVGSWTLGMVGGVEEPGTCAPGRGQAETVFWKR